MGWLRDYMGAVEPPISSFGRLADLALEHAAWPQDAQLKPRSLSTLFSKLDRGQELDWLRDRLNVQQVLAELMRRPLGDLRLAIGELPYEGSDKFLRLDDIRYAREVDLTREAPPPGIPRAAYDPPSWSPTWWTAPPGSGKSVVGLWLKCRGLARVAHISSRADLNQLPTRGALYLEIGPDFHRREPPLSQLDLLALRAESRPVLIASSLPPADDLAIAQLESPVIADYLPELVDWVAEHLDQSGHFQPDRAEQWMRHVALPTGAARSFGDALGLLGMLDELPPRSLLSKSLDGIGEHFVTRRVREANENTTVSPRLAQEAYPALLECAARCLMDGKQMLDGEYSIDTWTSLLSNPQSEDAPDPEWFTSALSGALGQKIARFELKRAASKLQPSAFALAKSLGGAQILVRTSRAPSRSDEGTLRALHPRWLTTLLSARAATTLIGYSSADWGQVLLNGSGAERIVAALVESARNDHFAPFFQLLDEFEPGLAVSVAALEGATVAASLVLLEGHDIPPEITEGLLSHNAETMMVMNGRVRSRTTLTDDPSRRAASNRFTDAYWLSGLAALCQVGRFPFPHLDPFVSTHTEPIFDTISSTLYLIQQGSRQLREWNISQVERKHLEQQILGQLRLLGDLFTAHDTQTAAPIGSIPRPACLEIIEQWSSPNLFEAAIRDCPLSLLLRYAQHAGASQTTVLGKIWSILADEPIPNRFFETRELEADAWANIPEAVLRARMNNELVIEWSKLAPHQFSQLLLNGDTSRLPQQAVEYCPIDAALEIAKSRGPTAFAASTLAALIERSPSKFATLISLYTGKPLQICHLLDSCPAQGRLALARNLPEAEALLKLPLEIVDSVRELLRRAVVERNADFQFCYDKLSAIEQGLWPLRRLP